MPELPPAGEEPEEKTVVFPAYRELQSFLVDNNIQIDSIEASFGNHHDYEPDLFIFNPDLSGGATLDVGVYGLWFLSSAGVSSLAVVQGSRQAPHPKLFVGTGKAAIN